MASCPRFQSRFVLFGDRKSYTGHGPCLYLRPSTNLRKISGVIEIINLGSGIGTSVIEIAETLKRIYGSTSNLNVTGDFRIGDIAHNVADTQKARKLLDFTPSISLQEGLTEFCEWVLGQETDNSRYEQSLTELERSGMFIRK